VIAVTEQSEKAMNHGCYDGGHVTHFEPNYWPIGRAQRGHYRCGKCGATHTTIGTRVLGACLGLIVPMVIVLGGVPADSDD
jgi:hypothetical protein